ncbi:MAG: hypothetical protein OJF49_000263 [Ktedonobacterales bacterium]|nr:MAG: hypothetical protein OJF49_000263 [Ktedonobacterales bacterium]
MLHIVCSQQVSCEHMLDAVTSGNMLTQPPYTLAEGYGQP